MRQISSMAIRNEALCGARAPMQGDVGNAIGVYDGRYVFMIGFSRPEVVNAMSALD
jgi:hypothetical protein